MRELFTPEGPHVQCLPHLHWWDKTFCAAAHWPGGPFPRRGMEARLAFEGLCGLLSGAAGCSVFLSCQRGTNTLASFLCPERINLKNRGVFFFLLLFSCYLCQ